MSDLLIEPWRKPEAKPDITEAIADAADRVTAVRVVIQREKRLSLAGKMAALTERANDFTRDTEKVLDGIAEKITAAEAKRDLAKEKHHGYYDGIVKGIEDSITAIDRLSNCPLSEGGEK